ncbi:MAG: hypothetical protein D6729_07715 [Deltaproteobacteria bacterium]|nr:MAG: hypothetical protein D6729_07715 [Deltaproteobacteria bacterium]
MRHRWLLVWLSLLPPSAGCWIVEGTLDSEAAQAYSRRFVEVARGAVATLEKAAHILGDARQSCAVRQQRAGAFIEAELPKLRERLHALHGDLERLNPATRRRAVELTNVELKFVVNQGFSGRIVGATEAFRRNCPAEANKVVPEVLEYRRVLEHASALRAKEP